MKSVRAYALFVLVIGSFAFLSGCGGSNDAVVAEVGDYDITVQEFKDYFENRRASFTSADDEFAQKRALLDSMIDTRILAQEAYKLGIDKSEELTRAVLANRDKFLLDALYNKEVASKTTVSDAEIKEYYENLKYQVRASHILVANEDTAKALFERIKAGENFEQLAYEYSLDQNAKRNKGDLGYFLWGSMVEEFQQAAFKMQPGEISPPVKTPYGYHIIKIVDRIPNDALGTFDESRKEIQTQLQNKKRMDLTRSYMEQIRDKYAVTIDTVTCQYLFHKRDQLYPPQVAAGLPRNDFDLEQLDRNERELIFATWNGGQLTLGAYLEQIEQVPPSLKPSFDQYDSLRNFVFMVKQGDILATEALKAGLDNDPRYLRKVALFKDLTMADIMKNDSIKLPDAPPDSVLYGYYSANIDQFSQPAKIHIYEILLNDELQAKKIKETVRSLSVFRDMAMDMTIRKGKRENGGDMGYIEKIQVPEIFAEAEKTPVGQIGGPVATGILFSVFYVADKIPASPKDYLAVRPQIVSIFMQQAKEQAVRQLLTDRKAEVNVEVKEDALWSTVDKSAYPADASKAQNN
jgi:peptidyl-prolyl cis-trans isomerase C